MIVISCSSLYNIADSAIVGQLLGVTFAAKASGLLYWLV